MNPSPKRRRTTYETRSSTRATIRTTTTATTTTTPPPPNRSTEQKLHQQTTTRRICRLSSRYRSSSVECTHESPRSDRSISHCSSSSGSGSSLSPAPDDDEFDHHKMDVKESSLQSSRDRNGSRNRNESRSRSRSSSRSRSRSRSSSRSKGEIIRRRWRQGDYRYDPSPSIAKRRRMLKPLASSVNGRAVVADDFLQFFQDPPQVAQLQDPRQRDEAIATFLKKEAHLLSLTSTTSTTSETTMTASATTETLNSSSSPPSYRKLNFTTKRLNQFRIFVASQFLIDSLRRRAKLSDRNYAFRIPYRPNSILFESLIEELHMKFSFAGHTSSPSMSGAVSEPTLFKGATANSILGLYMILIYRAQEFKTFQASASASARAQQQKDPWTPTKLSEIAMELLELDRAVCERYDRLHVGNSGRGEENGGVGGVGLGEEEEQGKRAGGKGEEDREEVGVRAGLPGIRSVTRRHGRKCEEEVLEGEIMENKDVENYNEHQEELLPALSEEQFVDEIGSQNSGNGGDDHNQEVHEHILDLEEGASVGSGVRDDLWEVMMVQTQTFQELAKEVVYLREEVAQLKRKGKSSQGEGDDGVVAGLQEEVARLQKRDKMREFETKARFREMGDRLACFQERLMKLMADKEN